MKHFLRSTAGKAITFIVCMLSLCALAACIFAGVIMAKMEFYTRPMMDLRNEILTNYLYSKGPELIRDGVYYIPLEEDLPEPETTMQETDPSTVPGGSYTALPQNIFLGRAILDVLSQDAKEHSQEEDTEDVPRFIIADSQGSIGIYTYVYGQILPENGNLIYRITDGNGQEITRSEMADKVEDWKFHLTFFAIRDADGFIMEYHPAYTSSGEYLQDKSDYIQLQIALKEGLPEQDAVRLISRVFQLIYTLRYAIFVIGGLAIILGIICFIILMCVSARRPDTKDLVPGPLNPIPFDLLLAIVYGIGVLLFFFLREIVENSGIGSAAAWILVTISVIIYANFLLGACMSFAARIKQHTLLKNTVICYLLRGIWILLRGIAKGILRLPLIWRTFLLLLALTILEGLVLAYSLWDVRTPYVFFFVLERIILIPLILYLAYTLRRLQKAGRALASGDLSYHTDTKGMFGDYKQHGENLNSIASGMAAAVDERMRSERMKTELITNVSHDIKTPLTSIINYAGLIGQESCENPKILEYAEVLSRQSERLKRLIEDLVEASKASTGNLDVHLVPCDANVFLNQAAGEYQEKLEEAGLSLVLQQPDHEVRILADGRRMWRIFDNLMNNICKYALSGTRVYLSLEETGNQALITFKNTSREPLNISEEELMERFTRGDASRSTEGSGLGLSIARSMAELQGGKLNIQIDGDLFKALLQWERV